MSWHNVWKPIPSLPGYEASRGGDIRRGDRVLAQHKHVTPRAAYMRVQVWIDGQRVWRRVNRLICEAFNGPGEDGQHAMHRNGDAFDNRAANLCWGTPADNYADQVRHGTAIKPPLSKKELAARERERKSKNWQESGNGIRVRSRNAPAPSLAQIKKAKKIKMMENVQQRASQ